MNTKETQQVMENNYYTVTTTFGNIKFKYLLTK
jgi:hypothetical protein